MSGTIVLCCPVSEMVPDTFSSLDLPDNKDTRPLCPPPYLSTANRINSDCPSLSRGSAGIWVATTQERRPMPTN